MVANSVVGGKSLLRDSTKGLIMHAENDHFKASTFFLFSQQKTPHSCNIKVQTRLGNSTLNPSFDVDPFAFVEISIQLSISCDSPDLTIYAIVKYIIASTIILAEN
jgi:hypothetical protein